MRFTLYVDDKKPEVAAAILRERALLQVEGRVYVKAYTRNWPGGMAGARRAMAKQAAKPGRLIHFRGWPEARRRATG